MPHPTPKLTETFPTKVLSSIPTADYPPGLLGINHPHHSTPASQTRPPPPSPFAGWEASMTTSDAVMRDRTVWTPESESTLNPNLPPHSPGFA